MMERIGEELVVQVVEVGRQEGKDKKWERESKMM